MMQESALVVSVTGASAQVEMKPSERCTGCGACSSREGGPMVAVVHNHVGARIGDTVVIEMPESKVLSAAALAYLLPLAGLIAGVALAGPLSGAIGVSTEPVSVVGALAGLMTGFLLLSRMDRRAADSGSYNMTIASIRTEHPSTRSEGPGAS